MLLPLGNTHLLNSVLRIAIFSIIIFILGGIPCLRSGQQPVMVVAVGSAGPSPQTEAPATRSTTPEPDYEKPPPGAEFAKKCYELVTNFTYSAIVAHNLDRSSAIRMHQARDRENFYELAANLSQTIMQFVEQLDRIGALFSTNGDVPLDMFAPMSCKPEKKVEEAPAEENSNTIVPWLLFVILVLVMYIGYLSYRMKIKYHRNSSPRVLIEDN